MARPAEDKPMEMPKYTKEPYVEDVGPRRIKSLKFSTFSGDEIRKSAVVQIWNNGFFGPNNQPIEHGLADLRLGPSSKRFNCTTCHGSLTNCPGHFGYLKLTLPVFNIGYLPAILNILKCICKSCARVLLPEKERRDFLKKMRNPKLEILQKNTLVKKVRERCKPSRCLRCGYTNGVVKRLKQSFIIVQDYAPRFREESQKEFQSAMSHIKETFRPANIVSAATALELFRNMIKEDCELLNLGDRPEKLITTDIAIPPGPIRPSSFVDSGLSNEDNISNILKKIINTNAFLREDLAGQAHAPKFLESWEHLQVQVVEYINSDAVSKDSKFRGFVQRLKGKQGRIRSNLSGKRVEYTGRTVISPDPNLKITEVAIPILMARVLTYPERVYHRNMEKLRQCIRNGPSKYPGANFVIYPDGRTVNLKFGERKNVANELKYGCVVERHLEDGDIVLFNRQPSLHRMSIMSHRARVMPWRTLRFNESVCNPYNADFDGDEMNMHVPQTEEARTEALMLMGVQNNLCTPKSGQILVASTQDFLTSSYLITRKDTFYDRASFCLTCSYLGDAMESIDLPTPALLKPIELWTGKQIFNVLIRPNAQTRVFLNFSLKEKNCGSCNAYQETMCPNDGFVYFRNSELISGQLGKGTLGNGNSNGMFSVLIRDYSPHAAASCMNRLAKLSARWIGDRGFSIGIDDVQPAESLNRKKKAEIDKGYETCDGFISKYTKGELQLQPGCNAAQTLEAQITDVLNNIRSTVGDVCLKELHWSNSPLVMSLCGSKGSPINISQMIACVGQQSVGGRRAPNGFIDRTLPHFPRNSKTPVAKGFVANSFYSGLTATEFFFHTMGGREGLVDTAVFLDMCISRYHSKRIEPGAPVGVIGAQSIGEPGTQMTLKTFHFAGVASMNVTLGVPRIKEIIDAIKNISTPIITTVLERNDDEISAKVVKGSLQKTLLEEVAKSIKVVFKPGRQYIAIVLDMELIESQYMGISAYSVKESILKHPKIKLKQEHVKAPAAYKLKIDLHAEKESFHADLHSKLTMLPKVIVKGISSVERVVISEDSKKSKTGEKSYKLFVEGTNLLAVMGMPGVKASETTSNHIIEVRQTLGIEAARKCIINEINYTMGSYGMNIDIRHMMILADVMTCTGEILSITRTGMTKMKDSVLMLASFEKTEEHLFNAALSGREDKIEGVSECVIMGTPMQCGTGILKLVQRVEPLVELTYAPDPIIT